MYSGQISLIAHRYYEPFIDIHDRFNHDDIHADKVDVYISYASTYIFTVYVNKMSPYSNSNYLSSTVSTV